MSAAVSNETWDNSSRRISEIDLPWITAGSDAETIAVTAATQPSIEDILLGGGVNVVDVYWLVHHFPTEIIRRSVRHAAYHSPLRPATS